MLTNEEYECLYREALLCLSKTRQVVNLFADDTVQRLCAIDGAILTDHEVIELWWGPKVANRMKKQRLLTESKTGAVRVLPSPRKLRKVRGKPPDKVYDETAEAEVQSLLTRSSMYRSDGRKFRSAGILLELDELRLGQTDPARIVPPGDSKH